MSGFGIEALSLALLVFTAVLSFNGHVFRIETSIRESIEQLDDVLITDASKLKPLLHGFSYFKHPSVSQFPFCKSRTRVEIKFYNVRHEYSTVSSPHTARFWWLDTSETDDLMTAIENLGGVEQARVTEEGLLFASASRSPVAIRRTTQNVMRIIRYSYVHRRK